MIANDKMTDQATIAGKSCGVHQAAAFKIPTRDRTCPNCPSHAAGFIIPRADAPGAAALIRAAARRLEQDVAAASTTAMRDLPPRNDALWVEAVDFRLHEGRVLGVLVSPWSMDLVLLPGDGEDWSRLAPGLTEIIAFPSGDYAFRHDTGDLTGGFKSCSLFSPMHGFTTQADATAVARAIMVALFETAPAEPDRVTH